MTCAMTLLMISLGSVFLQLLDELPIPKPLVLLIYELLQHQHQIIHPLPLNATLPKDFIEQIQRNELIIFPRNQSKRIPYICEIMR